MQSQRSAETRDFQSQSERSRHLPDAPTLQRVVAFKDECGRWWIRFYHRCGGWYEEPADELGSRHGSLREQLIKWYRYRLVWGRSSLGVWVPKNLSYVYPGRSCFAFWSEQHA